MENTKKQLKSPPVVADVTITKMIRWNVHSVLRNFVAEDIRLAQEIEEYLKKIGSKKTKRLVNVSSYIF